MKNTRTVDIIVPCYNEEQNIEVFYRKARQVEESLEGCSFSYIFIDDGSTDGTLDIIKKLCEEAVERVVSIKYISFSRNFGKEAAMHAGIRTSAGSSSDMAVIMDADLQHPPEMVGDMLKIMEETGCDCVAARRVSRKGEPKLRSLLARGFYRIMNRYSDISIADGAVDFRLMKKSMVKAIASMPETQRFSKGIFAWVGFDTEWIEFENVKRLSGESKWTVWGLAKYALDGFIDFANYPLKVLGAFGGVTAAGSALYLVFEIIKTLIMGKDTPGYASTICLILFFGGVIIAMLGLLGEYIGRMYLETKGRPVYVEKESNIDD
ncbi:MAG: glycosyltransferase family 2 protein [Lentihominibacter sp.]